MARRDRDNVFELVNIKGDYERPQKRRNIYHNVSLDTAAQPQSYADSTIKISKSELEDDTHQTIDNLESFSNKKTSVYKKVMKVLIAMAIALIIASLLFVFFIAIFNYLTSTEFKQYSATEFETMMDHIDQLNLSLALLNDFYEIKSAMQQDHWLNLTAQNKEIIKNLNKQNSSLSSLNENIFSQASRMQNLSIIATQNMEMISTERRRVNFEIRTAKENVSQLRNHVKSEIITVKRTISQLKRKTSTTINSVSELRGSLSSVQTTAERADRRVGHIAGRQLLNCSVHRELQRDDYFHGRINISTSYTPTSVSYTQWITLSDQ